MKNLHFCTPKLLEIVRDPTVKIFTTIRTGFTPSVYAGDVVNLNQFIKRGKDKFICKGFIDDVTALRRSQLSDIYKPKHSAIEEELARYNRKFHKDHWFFDITIRKNHKNLFEYSKLEAKDNV